MVVEHGFFHQGKNLVHLVDRPEGDEHCFRLHKDRCALSTLCLSLTRV